MKNAKMDHLAPLFEVYGGLVVIFRRGSGGLKVQSREYYLYKELPWYLDQRRMFLSFLMRID